MPFVAVQTWFVMSRMVGPGLGMQRTCRGPPGEGLMLLCWQRCRSQSFECICREVVLQVY
eukprot:1057489-Amphidinium_carterae.1